jgi:ABC-type lipoprotein release transport system permease subunit
MALPIVSYNFRNVRQRWRVTLLAIGGIALVVAVFIVLIALSSGLSIVLAATGSPENAIAVQRGSVQELTSGFARDVAQTIAVDGRVARNPQGQPLASPEIVVAATLPKKKDGVLSNVQFRGVSRIAFEVRSGIRIVQGRNFTPGLSEVIVGVRLPERFSGVNIGDALRIQRRDWRIVGIFDAEGSSFESEVWGDLDVMASAFNRELGYESLTLRLADPSQLAAWAKEIESNPRLPVDLKGERKFYEDQAGPVGSALKGLAIFVSVIMAIGAVFGAMNTMYAVVSQRTREIGTLRALGFSRSAILIAFVVEAVLIAAAAGLLGVILALPANGITTATGNVTFSELAFAFRITPVAIAAGVVFAMLMGFLGGMLPALRAARLPITSALREA